MSYDITYRQPTSIHEQHRELRRAFREVKGFNVELVGYIQTLVDALNSQDITTGGGTIPGGITPPSQGGGELRLPPIPKALILPTQE